MNILLIHSTWYQTGGDWTYIKKIKDLYELDGHKIIPFSTIDARNEPTAYENYFIPNLNYRTIASNKKLNEIFEVFLRIFYFPKAVKSLQKILDSEDIDVVQLHNIHNVFSLAIISLLRKRKIPIIWRVLDYKILCPNRTFMVDPTQAICTKCISHSYLNCIKSKCKKGSLIASTIAALEAYYARIFGIYDNVDYFFLQNEFSKKLFISAGFNPAKLIVLKNPFQPQKAIEFIPHQEEKKYFIYFGRLSPEKGLLKFIDMFSRLECKNLDFLIIGNGPQETALKNYVNSNNILNVNFLGPMWGPQLDNILLRAEFSIVPSVWHDPSPYSILQSFNAGIPVLGAKIGGIQDLILNGENGYLYNTDDFLSFKNAFNNISRYCTKMSRNCRTYLKKNHSPNDYLQKTISIFSSFS